MKPMLAAKDASQLRYPLLASPKIDGIRAVVKDGVVLSRSLKPIPNKWVQRCFGHLHGLDGELVVGAPNAPDVMQQTTSGVMSIEGEPSVTFHVFDRWDTPEEPFYRRQTQLTLGYIPYVETLLHVRLCGPLDLAAYERECLEQSYEGVMVRDPNGLYKYGRATAKEGYLTKIKRFQDFEAVVIDVEERMHNNNEAKLDELGHTKRSTHKAGKRPAGDLGALVCRTTEGVEFRIGTGFSAAQRVEFWLARGSLIGRIAKYKCFVVTGVKDAPRFPIFLGFRDRRDL